MSNSTRSRTPQRSARFLRMPDAVLNSVTQPDRRPSAEALQRALHSLGGARPDVAAAPGSPAAPPLRDRIFSGELRDVTGAVIQHGPGRSGRAPSPSAKTGSPHSRGPAPLKPPPREAKPWLKADAAHAKRVEPKHLPDNAPRPWLKGAPEQETGSADTAATETQAPLSNPEVVIMDAAELSDSPDALRGHDAGVEWLIVDETIRAAPEDADAESATAVQATAARASVAANITEEPATKDSTGVAAEAPPASSVAATTRGDQSAAPAAASDLESQPIPAPAAEAAAEPVVDGTLSRPMEPTPVEAAGVEAAPAADLAPQTDAAGSMETVPARGPAIPDAAHSESKTETQSADRTEIDAVVYAAAEPLFADPYSEPFVELPDFPEARPIVDLPEEIEQERIVIPPDEVEPERIVDVPDEALAVLFEELEARDEQYVPGLIFEYEYEYVEGAGDETAPGSPAESRRAENPEPEAPPAVRKTTEPSAESEGTAATAATPIVAAPVVATAAAVVAETPASAEISQTARTPESREAGVKPTVQAVPIAPVESQTAPVAPDQVDLDSGEADELKQELYAEIVADVGPELSTAPVVAPAPAPVFMAESAPVPEPQSPEPSDAGFEFEEDIDAKIEAELEAELGAGLSADAAEADTGASGRKTVNLEQAPAAGGAPPVAPAVDSGGDALDEVLLDDAELADHILEPAPVVVEKLAPAERHRLHDRLERAWQATPPPIAVSESALLEHLRRLHTVPQPEAAHFDGLLEFLLEKTRADALAILLLDTAQMVYRPLLSSGLDQRTATNFYLGLDDAFLAGPPAFQVLRKSDHPSAMSHFKKRFASEFFHRMDGIYLIALQPLGVPGFLALVYEDLELLTEHALESMLPPILTDVLPALQRYATGVYESERAGGDEDSLGFEDTSIVDQIYRLLKEVSRGGREPIEVLHLSFPELLQKEPYWRVRLHEAAACLLKRLHPDERLIEATPERITLILKSTPATALVTVMQDFAAEHAMELRHRSLRYPDHSRNFFNYIAPGI